MRSCFFRCLVLCLDFVCDYWNWEIFELMFYGIVFWVVGCYSYCMVLKVKGVKKKKGKVIGDEGGLIYFMLYGCFLGWMFGSCGCKGIYECIYDKFCEFGYWLVLYLLIWWEWDGFLFVRDGVFYELLLKFVCWVGWLMWCMEFEIGVDKLVLIMVLKVVVEVVGFEVVRWGFGDFDIFEVFGIVLIWCYFICEWMWVVDLIMYIWIKNCVFMFYWVVMVCVVEEGLVVKCVY